MSKPLNFMILQGEDVGRHLGCCGDSYAHTPHLDQLATEGTVFSNGFSHSPVCAPSRGGMVTGCYPYSVGNHLMRTKRQNPPRCFTHELVDAGYHVSWPTKLDFNLDPTEGWCSDQDAWWEKDAPSEPFLIYENFGETHESRMFKELPEWQKELPELSDVPDFDPDKLPMPEWLPDTPELRWQLVNYYTALAVIDIRIGKRLKWLEEQGLADSTVVIFLSDHGRGLPREKRWCYDVGVHLPLIVRWPGELEAQNTNDELVAWVDIAPTLLSLAGVDIPAHYQGQIFLGEDKAAPREHVFFGRDRMDSVYDKVRGARDKRWHYLRNDAPKLPYAQWQWYMEQQPIMPVMRDMLDRGEMPDGPAGVFFPPEKPLEELYDAEADPHMVNNLAADPAHAERLAGLRAALEKHLETVGDLGETTEEELIEKGRVIDMREVYAERTLTIPERYRPIPMSKGDYERMS